jgi:plastocyanin
MGRLGRGITAAVVLAAASAVPAPAQTVPNPPLPEAGGVAPLGSEVQHLRFTYGPLHVPAGGNLILAGPVTIEKPAYDGYVTRFKPDLVRADGSVPPVDVIHLHHGVWLNATGDDPTAGVPERIAASGEEKTILDLPPGYGYPVKATDVWAINHMLHNQTTTPENVWITYEIDYVPADSELGQQMKPAYPIWMDVRNGSAYPVFDVKRGTGGDGRFTYPDEATDPYSGSPLNEWTVTRSALRGASEGTLIWTAGHVHPGGLWTDLDLVRGTQSMHLFRSVAEYFDPGGPISWDMAMTATPEDWRVGVKVGDKLRVSATYETELASWYESMGIMIVMVAPGPGGPDPFADPPQTTGTATHGHLRENDNHGGAATGLPDPRDLPDGQTIDNRVGIFHFTYTPGNLGTPAPFGLPPAVNRGDGLRFESADASAQIFHTITACKPPCNLSTGVSYPLANGDPDFDSAELGYGPTGFTAAENRYWYDLPTDDLEPGTYTYFCRIHPFMRGAFRVK